MTHALHLSEFDPCAVVFTATEHYVHYTSHDKEKVKNATY